MIVAFGDHSAEFRSRIGPGNREVTEASPSRLT
jgi:hypothetical protein